MRYRSDSPVKSLPGMWEAPVHSTLMSSRFSVGTGLCSGRHQPSRQPRGRAVLTRILSFPPSGNGKLASWTSILGFVVMMSLDVGLG